MFLASEGRTEALSERNTQMTRNPFDEPEAATPPQGSAGITRLQLHMMDQRISQRILSDLTHIPGPTLSQYALGHRNISRRHLPILALALGINPPTALVGYATADECPVMENEWSDDNPFYYRRNYTTRQPFMDPVSPIKRHSYPHNAEVHLYEV